VNSEAGPYRTAPQRPSSDNFESQFPVRHQTKYFDFYLKDDSPQNATTLRLSGNFVDILKHDFFNGDRGYPIRVFMCHDERDFVQFMHRDLEIQDPSDFGIYIFSKKLLATYENSGLGTFTPETLHPLVEENLPHRPAWAMGGVPAFFEKFYGYWDGSGLVLYWGFRNPWRIRELSAQLTTLDLTRIVSENGISEQNESELRMAAIFLWEQGKFRRFLRLVAAVELHHLGLWFADPTQAGNAECPATVTPFDGDHNAGIQVLNTSNFIDAKGPLGGIK
jgi:hypothetical protein